MRRSRGAPAPTASTCRQAAGRRAGSSALGGTASRPCSSSPPPWAVPWAWHVSTVLQALRGHAGRVGAPAQLRRGQLGGRAPQGRRLWGGHPGPAGRSARCPGAAALSWNHRLGTTSMARIGFIGLGRMGLPMARNAAKAGHAVKAYDISTAYHQAAADAGVTPCNRVDDAVADCEVAVTMVPTGRQVHEVYLGDEGVLGEAAGRGAGDRLVHHQHQRGAGAARRRAGAGVGGAGRPGVRRRDGGGGGDADLHGRRRRGGPGAGAAGLGGHGPAASSMPGRRAAGRSPRSATT